MTIPSKISNSLLRLALHYYVSLLPGMVYRVFNPNFLNRYLLGLIIRIKIPDYLSATLLR